MTTGPAQLLARLQAFVSGYNRQGRTYLQFWADFSREAEELDRLAAADQPPPPELSDRYLELREAAHDSFGCPPGREKNLMG